MCKGKHTFYQRCARTSLFLGICVLFVLRVPLSAQSASQPPQTTVNANAPEMSSQEPVPIFKVNVKEVMVRVVARDAQGRAVGNLTKDDFQIFDKGKPQVITHFSVEQPGAQAAKEQKTSEQTSGPGGAGAAPAAAPERFVAYLFDDIHLKFGDLARVRDAAERQFATLRPTDRAAVFSTSGRTMLDYTDDRAKLHETLLRLKPNPISGSGVTECPDISYYMADLIVNKQDTQALQIAAYEVLSCNGSFSSIGGVVNGAISASNTLALNAAHMVLERGQAESRLTLWTLKNVVQELAKTPGERAVVLISPGFIIPDLEYEFNDIVDKALRSQIIISSLDARGLYALVPGGDADKPGPPDTPQGVVNGVSGSTLPPPAAYLSTFDSQQALANTDILASLADATGGVFFHNSNDLDEGFKRAAAAPEYFYLLGFSPQNLKPDGSFHTLKVIIKPSQKLTWQARRGYYAPKRLANPEQEAKEALQDAIFSQEEMHEVPLDLHTQFFKTSDATAKLTVLAHLDVRPLHFRKVEGRNGEELTVVSVLFDGNGTYIQGEQKVVTLRLKDETLASHLNNGITMKTSFDAKPGNYLVRVVVRDATGEMSAENGAVEIP